MRYSKRFERICAACLRLAAGSTALVACLPIDARPPPGTALVTLYPSEALLDGIPSDGTEDGWAIRYDRYLMSLGFVALRGVACEQYSEAYYGRIFDLLQPEPQRVSTHYALGRCDFNFMLAAASERSLLGSGVSAEDAAFLYDDAAVENPDVIGENPSNRGGISIIVQGTATRGGVTKSFAWAFRQQVVYLQCGANVNGTRVSGIELRSGSEQTVPLQVAGEALFRDDPDPALAKLRFDAFADADTVLGNADDEVTLAELDQVELRDLPLAVGYERLRSDDAPGMIEELTLADYLYLSAFPNVTRFRENGSCQTIGRSGYPGFD